MTTDTVSTRLDDKMLHPTPLIGAWVDWILRGAHRKQPVISLACVAASCAALMGRSWKFHGSYANQYMVGICPTTTGKERVKTGCEAIIDKLFPPNKSSLKILGGSDTVSDAGMIEELADCNQRLWFNDEFHQVIDRATRAGAADYAKGVVVLLLRAYECSAIKGRRLKSGETPTILSPYINYFGFSQPESFWPLASSGLTTNGLLGRFMVFAGDEAPADNEDAHLAGEPGNDVLDILQDWLHKTSESRMTRLQNGIIAEKEMSITPEALVENTRLRREIEATRQARKIDKGFFALTGRDYERMKKLAMVHAWSANPVDPTITAEGLQWAYQLVLSSRETMMLGITVGLQSAASTAAISAIEAYIRAGPRTGTELYRKFRGIPRWDDIVQDMCLNHIVAKTIIPRLPGKTGPPSYHYVYQEKPNV